MQMLMNSKTPIMGQNILTPRQLETFLLSREPNPRINCTPLELAEFFINESRIEGVRGDIAFMQSIHETGWFRFGGQVLPEQNNYAGIGAVNNSPTGAGAWFDSPQIGVRAQIHHLKTYATAKPLVNKNVSPRAHFVTRGIASHWEDLNGRWAVPGENYGQMILVLFNKALPLADRALLLADDDEVLSLAASIRSEPLAKKVYEAINILHEIELINSPGYWQDNAQNLTVRIFYH